MNRLLLVIVLLFSTSIVSAHSWTVNEYLANCSVVHQKTIDAEDQETVGYCMGVLKGAVAGILVSKSLEAGELKLPACLFNEGDKSFWDIQKDVLAFMRLELVREFNPDIPNSANAAVVISLLQLYPCLNEAANK